MSRTMSASEVSEELGISVSSVYSYVSRGLLRSEPIPGSRERRYLSEDVARLKRRGRRRDTAPGTPAPGGAGAYSVDTSLTLVNESGVWYRGHDAIGLARSSSVGEVASLLWTGETKFVADLFACRPPVPEEWERVSETVRQLSRVDAFQIALPVVAEADPSAYHIRPDAAARTGARIIQMLTAVAADAEELAISGIAETLQEAWAPRNERATDLIRMALILSADQGIDINSFAARAIASAGASPYAVVSGGLASFQGVRHAGVTSRVAALFAEIDRPAEAKIVLQVHLQRGNAIPGFGHPIFTNGDPRAEMILDKLPIAAKGSRELKRIDEIVSAGEEVLGEKPTLDFALVALAHVLELPEDAPLTLQALGRSIGWIAHAIEQYSRSEPIRASARYIGR
ncbi:MAG: citrate/2-methylcitrate synthase [Thermoanaerobaculia bacterium]|nr:citrate/2-methylcitrate synthase [Thermoanaerobaculia bacterium]